MNMSKAEVIFALREYKEKEGRNWKSKLRWAWMFGKDVDENNGLLRQARNIFGPTGIENIPELKFAIWRGGRSATRSALSSGGSANFIRPGNPHEPRGNMRLTSLLPLALLLILVIPVSGQPWIVSRGPGAIPATETGIQWMCQPLNITFAPTNITGLDNVSWIAVYNLTSGHFDYLFADGHDSEIALPYARGFACYITDDVDIAMNLMDCPIPPVYYLEPGLSLHGNPTPIDVNVTTMLESVDPSVSWAARWNQTQDKYEYFFPSDPGHSVNFMCYSCDGIWFYQTDDEPIEFYVGLGGGPF
jgi:hypothetical protein